MDVIPFCVRKKKDGIYCYDRSFWFGLVLLNLVQFMNIPSLKIYHGTDTVQASKLIFLSVELDYAYRMIRDM